MGVYLPIDLSSKTPAEGLFQSNAALLDLQRVENQLARLAPPSWPEDVFGRIDRDKAKAGKALFMEHCASCHNAWPYRWTEPNKYGKRFILVGLDPANIRRHRQSTVRRPNAPWHYRRTEQILARRVPGQADAAKVCVQSLDWGSGSGDGAAETQADRSPTSRPVRLSRAAYAAVRQRASTRRPRVTAFGLRPPFMHNGSVPNLYEMLIPAAERTKKFYLGGDFDPVKVGLDTTATSGTFLMDTTLLGNSNAGHSFQNGPRGDGIVGPLLTEDQRWALVEYLKSIPEEPGRVTPFGGFPEGRLPQP